MKATQPIRVRIARRIAQIIEMVGRNFPEALSRELRRQAPGKSIRSKDRYRRRVWYQEARRQLGEPVHPQRYQRRLKRDLVRGQGWLFDLRKEDDCVARK